MNFFAHALHCVDDPYRLAGVALPDWLTAVQPRIRCRTKHALPHVDAEQPEMRSLARGVVRHHEDDAWFHQTRAFTELSLNFARRIRVVTDDADGMRPSFVGHIMVELLLDADLISERPAAIDAYYESVSHLDGRHVAECVSQMVDSPAEGVQRVISRFASERFLYDYATDGRLCFRLNQVMKRVRLPPLPASFAQLLPEARQEVRRHRPDLLPRDQTAARE